MGEDTVRDILYPSVKISDEGNYLRLKLEESDTTIKMFDKLDSIDKKLGELIEQIKEKNNVL